MPNVEDIPTMTILIVDDDALISMSTVDMLEDLGHEVLEAHSGKRALEILREVDRVDLMITDYSMPKMNGMELATTHANCDLTFRSCWPPAMRNCLRDRPSTCQGSTSPTIRSGWRPELRWPFRHVGGRRHR